MINHKPLQDALMRTVQAKLKSIYQALQSQVAADGKTMENLVGFQSSGMFNPDDPTNNTFWCVAYEKLPVRRAGEADHHICNVLTFHVAYPPTGGTFGMIYIADQDRYEMMAGATYPNWIWSQTVQMVNDFVTSTTEATVITLGGPRAYK